MKQMRKRRLSIEEYTEGVLNGNRYTLSKAITLIESNLPEDAVKADMVLNHLMPATGNSIRVGITGVPGVGKSTFIEALGSYLTHQGTSLAVLTVDPSSTKSKGSILGDKTRMPTLSQQPLAFIRPSATGAYLGGVARKTREAMLLCEAAGYKVIIVETVGVGQSETEVHHMVDFFLLLMLAGAGDELQGIKKGIMEMADAVVINKADGDNLQYAKKARRDYQNALHLLTRPDSDIPPEVFICSALQQDGIADIWQFIETYQQKTKDNQYFYQNRKAQNLHWFRQTLHHFLENNFLENKKVKAILPDIEKKVIEGTLPATQAARELLAYLVV